MTTAPPARRSVVRSRWPDPHIPTVTLPRFLFSGAADRTGAPALVDGSTGAVVGHGDLAERVQRVAAGFAAHGLRPGEVVAVLAPNCPDWLVAAYGAMTAGGVVSGINPLYTPGEIAAALGTTRARFVVTVPALLPATRSAIDRSGVPARIVVFGDRSADAVAFDELLAADDGRPEVPVDPAVDLALLPFSSGTSGLPKAVRLPHRALVANVLQQQAAVPMRPSDRVLAVAPFFDAVGLSVTANAALSAGAAVVTMQRFDLEDFLRLVEEHRITVTIVVPPIVLALTRHPAVDRYDLSSLEWLGCGAAPLGAELQQACARRLGRPVLQGYGLTEVTAAAALWPQDVPVVHGSAGMLLPGVQARVVDLVTGGDVAPGAPGELWLRSPAAMTGYLGEPAATAATVNPDRWLHTGDVARIDADGALFIDDRVKELIKVKGFQVAPAELEAVLRTIPGSPKQPSSPWSTTGPASGPRPSSCRWTASR